MCGMRVWGHGMIADEDYHLGEGSEWVTVRGCHSHIIVFLFVCYFLYYSRVGPEGQEEENNWHWQNEILEDASSSCEERIQRR
jgi:hypothetical protein